MPAYVICHVERHDTGGAAVTRAFLTRRIAELWNGAFRFDATWIVQADKTSDEIRDELTPVLAMEMLFWSLGLVAMQLGLASSRQNAIGWLSTCSSKPTRPSRGIL
jgi:hypothetical protein